MSTIYKVARLAGVSSATVSRVLNNRESVSPDTVARVEQAAQKLQFQPRKGTLMRTIAIMIPPYESAFLNPYMTTLLCSVCNALFAEGFYPQLFPFQQNSDGEMKRFFGDRQVQGMILMTFNPSRDLPRDAYSGNLPYVSVGFRENEKAQNYVLVDDMAAGYQAAKYLISLGHRHIAVATAVLPQHPGHRDRLDGIRKAVEESGENINLMLYESIEADTAFGESLALQLSMLSERPTAAIATVSHIALGLNTGLRRLGVKIPEDFSLVGFEDNDELSTAFMPITAMHQPTRRLGQMLVQRLITLIKNEKLEEIPKLDFSLLVRNSTGPAKRAANQALQDRKGADRE